MASQHHFTDRLRSQLNDSNASNLDLQALLAQRDDALAACNARLQSVLSATSMNGDPQFHLQNELRVAKEATINAETRLSQTSAIFNQEQSEWKQSIEKLQREISVRDAVLSDANYCLAAESKHSTTIDELRGQLTTSHAELKRTKQYAAGIQKQFEAEKKANTPLRPFPATAAAKSFTDVDQDDEEIVDDATRIKQERMAGDRRQSSSASSRAYASGTRSSCSGSQKSSASDLPHRPIFNRITNSSLTKGLAPPPRQPKPRARQTKRKRSSLEDEDSDYDDLEIDMDDTGGRSGRRPSKAVTRDREIEHVKQTFNFKAIVSYEQNGDRLYLDSKQDLSDVCPELWERIQNQHEAWERACGEDWRYDLESKFPVSTLAKNGAKPPCVTTKLLRICNGKAMWREGCEGKYACRVCVQEKRPCFTWDGEELYLLPLDELDRTYPEENGFEIRTWLDIK